MPSVLARPRYQVATMHPDHDLSLKAERCRRSLYEFTKEYWSTVVPDAYEDNWHIKCVCDHLQAITNGEIRKLLINIPPGSAKSTMVSVMWPAWEWIDHPTEQSLFGSFDENLALRDSVKCRMVFDSHKYKEMFLPRWKMAKDQNAKGFYTNTVNGNRYTFGMNAGGKMGWRGHKVVVDDPNDTVFRFDSKRKAAAFDTYSSILSTRVNKLATAKFVIVQQRVAYDDFTGRLLKEGGYEHVKIAAYFTKKYVFFTKIGWTDPRKEEGEGFFESRYPHEALEHLRTKQLGEEGFSAQFQQEPFPEGGSIFNSSDFVYWEHVQGGLIQLHYRNGTVSQLLRLDMMTTFVTGDFAASEETTADWTVFAIWAVTNDFNLLLLNVIRARMRGPQSVDKAVELFKPVGYNGRRHVAYIVEDNGLGLPLYQAMQDRGLPVMPVHVNRTDKIVRSLSASIAMAAGRIFWPRESPQYPWMEEWKMEILNFPADVHDDQVDNLSLAAEAIYKVGITGLKNPVNMKKEELEAHKIMENRNNMNAEHVNMGKRFFKG